MPESLFPEPPPPLAARLAPRLRDLAGRGIYFGTSSWKYPGWMGQVYRPETYQTRGKFSQAKFDRGCLAEYAETFPIVGGDFSFYQFPTADYWGRLFGEIPASLRLVLKVTEEVTVASWPKHARYGARAGSANPSFLDPDLFNRRFARPLEPHRDRVAALVFEFGTMGKAALAEFPARLDSFLGAIGGEFRRSVEVRNPELLGPDYFEFLHRHNTAHVFNAWTRMPTLDEQAEMDGAFTADLSVVRALLRKGRAYEDAVSQFEPYDRLQEPHHPSREGMLRIARRSLERRKPAFLLVNNRLEGNAPATIEQVVEGLG